jgi:hypothetical protein
MIFLKKLAKKFPRQNSIFNNDQLLKKTKSKVDRLVLRKVITRASS